MSLIFAKGGNNSDQIKHQKIKNSYLYIQLFDVGGGQSAPAVIFNL